MEQRTRVVARRYPACPGNSSGSTTYGYGRLRTGSKCEFHLSKAWYLFFHPPAGNYKLLKDKGEEKGTTWYV